MIESHARTRENLLEHPLIWPSAIEFRRYQIKMAQEASKKNTLIILPTALGKTVVSAIVAANVLYNYGNVKVLVMAPTRPLVAQHRMAFMKMLKLRAKDTMLLTGKTPPNYRTVLWKGDCKVYFSTPQVVRNDLLARRLSLENFGLIVFDECHRAVKNYAYTKIAESYVFQSGYPLILGMTASPGSDLGRVMEVCRNLCIERVEYRNEEDADVKPYIHPIEVKWKRVNLPLEYLAAKTHIRVMLDKRLNWLRANGIIKRKPEYITRSSLIKAGDQLRLMLGKSEKEERGRIFTAIINQSLALTLFHMIVLLETQGFHTLKSFLRKVDEEKRKKRSYGILVNDQDYKKLEASVKDSSLKHPKVELLKQIVGFQIQEKPSSRILVFTQYRATASHIVEELNMIKGVKAERFVGQTSKKLDKGLTQTQQSERIKMLEEGILNVLVATSIAEEGLDIPSVDNVIFYEPIPSEIRYIQRRGRTGRKAPGKVEILATNETLDMTYLYASKKKTEKMKGIAKRMNTKLHPILRRHPRPTVNPLTSAELRRLEDEAAHVNVEPETVETETEFVKDFGKKVEKAAGSLYLKLLDRGAAGEKVSQLTFEMEPEGVSPLMLRGATAKLMREGLIAELSPRRYAATSSLKPKGRTYEITVEKILPGVAIVIVDDKWRARLTPNDYDGPRVLIKKNSKFMASGELYRLDGVLCLRVKEVIETLD